MVSERKVKLYPGERLDDLQRNGYHLIQNPQKFCFGMDAVLLAAYAKAKMGERVLDLCCGNGVIPILMEARTSASSFVGVEIQHESAALAVRNVQLNGLEDKIQIVEGDLAEAVDILGAASFHVITMNPPYMKKDHGLINPSDSMHVARHETTCTIEEMLCHASSLLRDKGRFYMVHRPFRLGELMIAMTQANLQPKRMRLVYPFVDREPNMVLLEGLKGGNSGMVVEKPLIVYESQGVYTEEVRALY